MTREDLNPTINLFNKKQMDRMFNIILFSLYLPELPIWRHFELKKNI